MFTLKWGKHTNSFSSSIWSLKKIILIFLERCYTTEVANTYFVFSLSGHYFTTLQNILYFKIMTIVSFMKECYMQLKLNEDLIPLSHLNFSVSWDNCLNCPAKVRRSYIHLIFSLPHTEKAKYSFCISCKTGFLSDNFHSLKSHDAFSFYE